MANEDKKQSNFERLVSSELPRRFAVDNMPANGNLPAGKKLISTGVGLQMKVVDDYQQQISDIKEVVLNATEEVIAQGTPVTVVGVHTNGEGKTKYTVRPAAADDEVVVGVTGTDIPASDLSDALNPVFAEAEIMVRGLVEINKLLKKQNPEGTIVEDVVLEDVVYSGDKEMTGNKYLTSIPVGQVVKVDKDAAKTTVFVTLMGVERVRNDMEDATPEEGIVVVTRLIGDKDGTTSYKFRGEKTAPDSDTGIEELSEVTIVPLNEDKSGYLAIEVMMSLETGKYQKVVNAHDGSTLDMGAPTIRMENGMKKVIFPFNDPAAAHALAAAGNLKPRVVHPAGRASDELVILTGAKPTATAYGFGVYPGSQTELKQGDAIAFNITPHADFVITKIEVQAGGVVQSQVNKNVSGHVAGQDISVNLTAADRGNTTSDQGVTFRMQDNTGVWSDWVDTKAAGVVDRTNIVKLNDLYPSIAIAGVVYPDGQGAVKDSENATVNHTASNFDKIEYISQNNQLTIATPDTFEGAKQVTRKAGDYNVTAKNFKVKATRNANGAVTSRDAIVKIAHVAPTVQFTVVGVSSNKLQSAPASAPKHYNVNMDFNQDLLGGVTEADVTVPGSGTLSNSKFSGSGHRFTNQIHVEDSEARGDFEFNLASGLVNLAGIPVSVTKKGYKVSGFVKRTVTIPAWPNRSVDLGVEVHNVNDLECSNLSKGQSGSLNFSYAANKTDALDKFTIVNESFDVDPNGKVWYNNDIANAVSNTSGSMKVEIEEKA